MSVGVLKVGYSTLANCVKDWASGRPCIVASFQGSTSGSTPGVFIQWTGMDHWTTGMDHWTTGMDYWNTGMDYWNMPVTSLKYQCQPYTCMHACTERLF